MAVLAKKFLGADNVFTGVVASTVAADITVSDYPPAMVAFDQFGTFTDYGVHKLREPLADTCFLFAVFFPT